jgi:DeoR/GlpR family transcriptional regulator of sugar metabolism
MLLIRLRAAQRVPAILEALSDQVSLNVGELARRFDVSTATIRRDLERFERQQPAVAAPASAARPRGHGGGRLRRNSTGG